MEKDESDDSMKAMDIVKEVFAGYHADKKKLQRYGFRLQQDHLYFKQPLTDGFMSQIRIDEKGKITAKVIETDLDEEYININSDDHYGAFVSELRQKYREQLTGIRESCFIRDQFASPQALYVSRYLKKEYGDEARYSRQAYPDQAVFADHVSGRQYAIIMKVKGKKLNKETEAEEIICLKADPETIAALQNEAGFCPAYTLDHQHWFGIILDGTLADEALCSLVDYSHRLIETSDAWLVPANVEYYDVIHCFDHQDTMHWKQTVPVHVGDSVYLYVGKPYSAILYKCIVEECDIPYEYQDQNIRMSKVMKIRLLKRFRPDTYPLAYLNSIGIRMVRGSRKISREQSEKLS